MSGISYNVSVPNFEDAGFIRPDSAATGRLQESRTTSDEFREAYERHAADILRYAIRCTGRREIAEELTSEAFLKMYQHRESVDLTRAGAWLTATVKNLAIDYWRRREVEQREENVRAAAAQSSLVGDDRWQELLEHPALKPEHRVCLTLHYVHGMENREITSHTGLTGNQVKSALQYGLKLLRKAFGGKGTP